MPCYCLQLGQTSSSKLESMSSGATNTDDKASAGSGSVQEAGIGATTISAAPGGQEGPRWGLAWQPPGLSLPSLAYACMQGLLHC